MFTRRGSLYLIVSQAAQASVYLKLHLVARLVSSLSDSYASDKSRRSCKEWVFSKTSAFDHGHKPVYTQFLQTTITRLGHWDRHGYLSIMLSLCTLQKPSSSKVTCIREDGEVCQSCCSANKTQIMSALLFSQISNFILLLCLRSDLYKALVTAS